VPINLLPRTYGRSPNGQMKFSLLELSNFGAECWIVKIYKP